VVLLVVDENSMVDLMLMQALLKAALLIVGSGAVPVRLVRLAEVFRQTAESKTITTVPAISAGKPDRCRFLGRAAAAGSASRRSRRVSYLTSLRLIGDLLCVENLGTA
jgi:hypothetical protein